MSYPPPGPPPNNRAPAQAPQPQPYPQSTQPPPQAGPGGAYGPPADTGAPSPGQPVRLDMAKPGTVTGIQVILWIFAALSALGDLYSVVSLADAFTPIGMLTLVVALYFTVQSLLSPIHIERGKRWAWIWSVVSACLGLATGLVAVVMGVQVSEYTAMPLVIGIALGSMYGVLLGLLLSKSAKAWILMHRVQRGEVQAAMGADGTGVPGVLTQRPPEPERPERKPGVVTAAQTLLALLAIPGFLLLPQQLEAYAHEAEIWGYADVSEYFDGHFDLMVLVIGLGVAAVAVSLVNLLIALGLGRGRRGARIFGVIWLGVVFAAMGIAAAVTHMFMREQEDDMISVDGRWVEDPFEATWTPFAFWGFAVGAVLAIAALVLMSNRGTRLWTPPRPPSIVILRQPMR